MVVLSCFCAQGLMLCNTMLLYETQLRQFQENFTSEFANRAQSTPHQSTLQSPHINVFYDFIFTTTNFKLCLYRNLHLLRQRHGTFSGGQQNQFYIVGCSYIFEIAFWKFVGDPQLNVTKSVYLIDAEHFSTLNLL